ncbi:cold shock and DUF1294 domain-containing protein [Balneatrix alpica]|uniref:cold shock and DUF1294 domain-containing protein n=1 Tax=Balneatrix alpica TaxID=75684 RepID=UPI00273872D0|nr:cold shock and DUF1294 domain-containing protein [Balneatrix alpica]
MRYQGKLTDWNDAKGFGFVEPNGGGAKALVHIKAFTSPSRRPINGDLISYSLHQQQGGRYQAQQISLLNDRSRPEQPRRPSRRLGSCFTLMFCLGLAAMALLGRLPQELLYFYAGISLLSFIFYGLDKSAARGNRWRTPESQLHLLALAGGWPGAFWAQNLFRHKTNKGKFIAVYWLTVAANLAGLYWLLSAGHPWLMRVLATLDSLL